MTRPLPTPEVLEAVRRGLRPTSRWGILGASRKQLDRTAAETAAEIAATARARVDADPRYQAAKAAHDQAVDDYNRAATPNTPGAAAVRAQPDLAQAAQRVTTTQQALKQAEADAYASVYGQTADTAPQPATTPPAQLAHHEDVPVGDGHEVTITDAGISPVVRGRPATRP